MKSNTGYSKWIWLIAIPLILNIALYVFMDIRNAGETAFPYEYREGANIYLTKELADGNNPYVWQEESNEPGLFYMYPFAYSLATALISKVLPISLVQLHYLMNILFLLTAALLAALLVKEKTKTLVAPVLTFLLMLSTGWRYTYVHAFPDNLAILISVVILYLVAGNRKKQHTIWCAVLTVLLFYTKQYFVIIGASVWIYLFLTNKKECIKFTVSGAVIGLLSIVAVQIAFPLYFTYSILFMKGSTTGISLPNLIYCIRQFARIGYIYLPLAALILYRLYQIVFREKTRLSQESNDTFMMIHVLITGLCLLYFGLNDGSWLTYFLQLLIPAAVIWGSIILENIVLSRLEETLQFFLYATFAAVLMLNIVQNIPNKIYYKDEDKLNWAKAYELVENYQNPDEIYLFPAFTNYTMEHDLYQYDAGQVEYVTRQGYELWKDSSLYQLIFPDAGNIYEVHFAYQDGLKQKIENKELSMIAECDYLFFEEQQLEKNYEKIETIMLKTGIEELSMDFWIPKQ